MYNEKNWYWIVGSSVTQVYSSASGSYVSNTDAIYQAWLNAGNLPTKISANDMLLMQIQWLENSITPRMIRESLSGSTVTFPSGKFSGMTSSQAIVSIQSEITSLRSQITN